jgi:hypothetical protein
VQGLAFKEFALPCSHNFEEKFTAAKVLSLVRQCCVTLSDRLLIFTQWISRMNQSWLFHELLDTETLPPTMMLAE